jgi:hypothetical protein
MTKPRKSRKYRKPRKIKQVSYLKLPDDIWRLIFTHLVEEQKSVLPQLNSHFFFSTRPVYASNAQKRKIFQQQIDQLQSEIDLLSSAVTQLKRPLFSGLKALCHVDVLLFTVLFFLSGLYVYSEQSQLQEEGVKFSNTLAPDNQTCREHGLSDGHFKLLSKGYTSTFWTSICNYTMISMCAELCEEFGKNAGDSWRRTMIMANVLAPIFSGVAWVLWHEKKVSIESSRRKSALALLPQEQLNKLSYCNLVESTSYLENILKQKQARLDNKTKLMSIYVARGVVADDSQQRSKFGS